MKSILKNIFALLAGVTIIASCVDEQDFGQYDNLSVTPTLEASMLYIEAPESLVNSVSDANVVSRNFNFDAFSSALFAERVIEGTVSYVVENTTSKELDFQVEYLDADGNLLDTEEFTVEPGMDFQRDVPYGGSGKNIEIIKSTSSLLVTATNQGDMTSTSDLPDPKIILKSSGKFRMRVK